MLRTALAASLFLLATSTQAPPVLPGIETFLADVPPALRGKRVALITNHSGVDRIRRPNIDLISAHKDLKLVALLAPEHGIRGDAQDGVTIQNETDPKTGLPIHSLYLSEDRGPTDAMLKDVDVIVYDLQEVGGRTWTYVSTMGLAMRAAAKKGIPFVVLDRPNPIGGEIVEGALLDPKFTSFVGMFPIPARHGMTVGELAMLFNKNHGIGANLIVAQVKNWRRSQWQDETGLPWVNPSPNLRSLAALTSYPGSVYFEGTNLSEGRGTDRPFEQIGAGWLNAADVVAVMNKRHLPGIRFEAITMTVSPSAAKWKGQTVPAIRFAITDRQAYRPVRTALLLIDEIRRQHLKDFAWSATIDRLTGSDKVRLSIEGGTLPALLEEWDREASQFRETQKPFLLPLNKDRTTDVPLTLLCIATYLKGHDFLRECHRQGCRVLLLTEEKLRDAAWPREAVDDFYFIKRGMPHEDIRRGAAHLARRERIDRIVALDDFDVELAAMLREHLFIPGMGETTGRAFRDKLSMRRRARSAEIPCPEFVHVLNEDAIREWTARIPPPWVMKPRGQAAAIGIKKITSSGELWSEIEATGDLFAEYVLEQFVPGDVFHVDSIVFDRQVRFAVASRYSTPPMAVAHEGGIFATRTLHPSNPLSQALLASNARVLGSFGLVRGASHTEFIRAASGDWYFLETSARVGGAFIVDVVEAASGVNLWREWAKVEIAGENGTYDPPAVLDNCGGIVLSLARQEQPDLSAYDDPEIAVRVRKSHHAGLIVTSPDADRIEALIADYTRRFYQDFHASAPPPASALD